MTCDWLANWECLFPGDSTIKIHALGKEISTKASLSEKMNNIENSTCKTPQLACLSNTTKKRHNFHLYKVKLTTEGSFFKTYDTKV